MKAVSFVLLAAAASSFAQTWTGAVDANWNNAGNWSGGLVPAGGPGTAVLFDQATQPSTTNNIPGGLTVNSLVFGENSGPRALSGNAITFDGTSPALRLLNTAGTGNTTVASNLILNQNLTLQGGPDIDHQLVQLSSSVISGPGGITVESGISAFNGGNSYTGPTLVRAGGLGLAGYNSLGGTPLVTVQPGGWIQLLTGTFGIGKPLVIGGEGMAPSPYAMASTGGTANSWSGGITLSHDTRFGAFNGSTLALDGGAELALAGHSLTLVANADASDQISIAKVISGSGNLIVNSFGSGKGVLLSGENTFTGTTLVSTGTLTVDADVNLGAAANPVTLNGGTLRTSVGMTVPATRSISIGANGGGLRGGDGASPSRALVMDTPISGNGPLFIRQRVRLNAAGSFNGDITIRPGGTLTAASDAAFGPSANAIVLGGEEGNPARVVLPADYSTARAISLAGGGVVETTAPVTFAASFSGEGELGFSCYEGEVTLSAANTHTGGTRVESGTVRIHNDSALGAPGQPLHLTGQGMLGGTADITLPASRPIRLHGGGFDTTGIGIHVQGDMEGTDGYGVDVRGTGTFRFDGVMTALAGYVRGATLAGTGTFASFMELSQDATLAPGGISAKGSLSVGGLRMNSGTLRVRVGGGASDKVVLGQDSIELSVRLQIIPDAPVSAGETFTIVERADATPYNAGFYADDGSYLGNDQTFTRGGIIWSINYQGGDGNDVTITALNGNAVPLAVPRISSHTFFPPTSQDPNDLASYPSISGEIAGGVAGSTVFLESSTDLGDAVMWEVIGTFTLDEEGAAAFPNIFAFDPAALSRNFFRLRIP